MLLLAFFSAYRTIFFALHLPIGEIGPAEQQDGQQLVLLQHDHQQQQQQQERHDATLLVRTTTTEERGGEKPTTTTSSSSRMQIQHDVVFPRNHGGQGELRRRGEESSRNNHALLPTKSRGGLRIPSSAQEQDKIDDDDDNNDDVHSDGGSNNSNIQNNGMVAILGMHHSGIFLLSELLEKLLVGFPWGGNHKNFENRELVHVRWNGRGIFYPAMVIGSHDNGTYDILYDDGDYELAVPKEIIRSKDLSRVDPNEIIRNQNDIFLHHQNVSWEQDSLFLMLDPFDFQYALKSWNASDESEPCGKLAWKMFQNHGMLAAANNTGTPWLMSDPQLSLTLPIWSRVLNTSPTSAVIVYRNPLDVAMDLDKTKNIPLQKGFLLWMTYNMRAIENSMGQCRIAISYNDLVLNPLAEIQSIAQTLHDVCGFTHFHHDSITPQEYLLQGMQWDNKWMSSHGPVNATNNTQGYGSVLTDTCQVEPYSQGIFGKRSVYNDYVKAMKIYCDMINKRAFQEGYMWPTLEYNQNTNTSMSMNNKDNAIKRKLSISENMCKVIHRQEQKWSCSLQSESPQHQHSLARFVIFQRDLGHKLQDLVAHYHSAVPFDSLVIIDHNGSDKVTADLLQQYSKLGAHIWRCKGSFDQKAIMWSHVAKFYANASDFVFPLDGDEYMTILQQQQQVPDHNNNESLPLLRWNHEALQNELSQLQDNGLAFKTIRSNPLPIDCELDEDQMPITTRTSTIHQPNVVSRSSSQCRLKYTVSDIGHYCYNKVFYRGRDLTGITHGNHNPPNHVGPACREKYKFNKDLEDSSPIKNSDGLYNLSNFTIIHMQSIEFSDFVLHRLRGASDKEFNKITKTKKGACNPYGSGGHYCDGWLELLDVSFDFYKMKDIYKKTKCKWDPKMTMLLPLDETFGPSCHPERYKRVGRIKPIDWVMNMFRMPSSSS